MLTRSRRAKQAGPGTDFWIKSGKDPPGTEVRKVSAEVGLGVFASKEFLQGDFILEYPGTRKLPSEVHNSDQTFIYYFKHKGKDQCIDATQSKRKGRFINDEWIRPNSVVRKIEVEGHPKLAVFALTKIEKETEIRFDYGDREAPWRSAVVKGEEDQGDVSDDCDREEEDRGDKVVGDGSHTENEGAYLKTGAEGQGDVSGDCDREEEDRDDELGGDVSHYRRDHLDLNTGAEGQGDVNGDCDREEEDRDDELGDDVSHYRRDHLDLNTGAEGQGDVNGDCDREEEDRDDELGDDVSHYRRDHLDLNTGAEGQGDVNGDCDREEEDRDDELGDDVSHYRRDHLDLNTGAEGQGDVNGDCDREEEDRDDELGDDVSHYRRDHLDLNVWYDKEMSSRCAQNPCGETDKGILIGNKVQGDFYSPRSPNPFEDIPVLKPTMYQSAGLDEESNNELKANAVDDESDESKKSKPVKDDETPSPVSLKVSSVGESRNEVVHKRAILVENEVQDNYYSPRSPNPFEDIPILKPTMYQSAGLDEESNKEPKANGVDESNESKKSEHTEGDETASPVSLKVSAVNHPLVTNHVYSLVSQVHDEQTGQSDFHMGEGDAQKNNQNRSTWPNPFKGLKFNQPESAAADDISNMMSSYPNGKEKEQHSFLAADDERSSVSSDGTGLDIACIIERLDKAPVKQWSPRSSRVRKIECKSSLSGKVGYSVSEVDDPRLVDAVSTAEQEHVETEVGFSESEVDDSRFVDAESTAEQKQVETEAGYSESEEGYPRLVNADGTAEQEHVETEAGFSEFEVDDPRVVDAESTAEQKHVETEAGYSESEVNELRLVDAESTAEQEHVETEVGFSESEVDDPRFVDAESTAEQKQVETEAGYSESEEGDPRLVNADGTAEQEHVETEAGYSEFEVDDPRVVDAESTAEQKHVETEAGYSESEVNELRLVDAASTAEQEHVETEAGYSEPEVDVSRLVDAERTAEQENMEAEDGYCESEVDESGVDDADYVPEESSESDSNEEITNSEEVEEVDSLDLVQSSVVTTSNKDDHWDSGSDSDQGTTNDGVASSALSAQGVRVATSNNTEDKRKWDKKHYCPFCSLPYAKLPRHLFSLHANETEVAQVMAQPVKSKKRKLMLDVLRNKGNHAHNREVLKNQRGYLVTTKRPTDSEVSASDYLPCDKCFGYFVKGQLWKHVKNCRMQGEKRKGKRHQSQCALLLPLSRSVEESFKRVLGTMQNDDITLICRNDSLILTFGQKLHEKSASQSHQFISQKMRELGRFVKAMRIVSGVPISLSECITPEQYDSVVRGVRKCAGYNTESRCYETPSLALKLGHSLKRCADILIAKAIKAADKARQEEAERFKDLCSLEWAESVSSHALKTLHEKKWNKPTILPLTDDVVLLHQHLSHQMADCSERMGKQPDKLAWLQLAEATLAKIILFNRRRSGETERMYLSDYQNQTGHTNVDIKEGLSKWEQNLCDNLTRVEIRGKRGRKVPILFTEETKKCVDILVKSRELVGVNKDNPYVFALPSVDSTSSLRGHDCLRKLSMQCGAKNPSALTSTRLRKQIATVSQLFCLQKNELDILANFLGHDIMVHRAYYRLPEDTVQMTKVAKILFALEKGNLQPLKGQRLDDVEFPLNDECSSYEESDVETEGLPDEGSTAQAAAVNKKQRKKRCQARKKKSDKGQKRKECPSYEESDVETEGLPDKGSTAQAAAVNKKQQKKRFQARRKKSDKGQKRKECSSYEESDVETEGLPDEGSIAQATAVNKKQQKKRCQAGRKKSNKGQKGKGAKMVRSQWSTQETEAIKTYFKANITLMRVPRKHECETSKIKQPILAGKQWMCIKNKVYSLIQQQQRQRTHEV